MFVTIGVLLKLFPSVELMGTRTGPAGPHNNQDSDTGWESRLLFTRVTMEAAPWAVGGAQPMRAEKLHVG